MHHRYGRKSRKNIAVPISGNAVNLLKQEKKVVVMEDTNTKVGNVDYILKKGLVVFECQEWMQIKKA